MRFFFLSVYIRNMFLKSRVIDSEYIVKISRGIVKHVYKSEEQDKSSDIEQQPPFGDHK